MRQDGVVNFVAATVDDIWNWWGLRITLIREGRDFGQTL